MPNVNSGWVEEIVQCIPKENSEWISNEISIRSIEIMSEEFSNEVPKKNL